MLQVMALDSMADSLTVWTAMVRGEYGVAAVPAGAGA